MNSLSNQDFILALIVMSPLLLWGIWIVSEESFDQLNSRNKFSNLKLTSLLNLSTLSSRKDADNQKGKYLDIQKSNSQYKKTGSGENVGSLSNPDQSSELKEVMDYGSREIRRRWLPAYFALLISLVAILTVLVISGTNPAPQLASITLVLATFIYQQKQKSKVERERISKELEAEMPSQIQLLTILVSSGMSPAKAISVLSQRSDSMSSQALRHVISDIESGLSIVEALDKLKRKHGSTSLRRFITTLTLGIERGSSLSPILIAQVRDARLANKSEVMRRAGKAEIALMIPVVFLILPISILFALWPSYQQLGAFL